MKPGSHDDDRGVVFRCHHCGAEASCRQGYRDDLMILCPECGGEITRQFRRAYFAGVSADIHARLVARDNEPFLSYLAAGWDETNAG